MQEIFSPLACGGKLVLAEPGGEKDTQYLADVCMAKRVTFVIYVPSQLDALMQACTCCDLCSVVASTVRERLKCMEQAACLD